MFVPRVMTGGAADTSAFVGSCTARDVAKIGKADEVGCWPGTKVGVGVVCTCFPDSVCPGGRIKESCGTDDRV